MYKIFIDETLFYTPEDPSYGLSSAVLTCSAGKVASLELTIPPTHPLYDLPKLRLSEVVVYRIVPGTITRYDCLFVGRPMTASRDFHNNKTLYCESVAGILNDICTNPWRPVNYTDAGDAFRNSASLEKESVSATPSIPNILTKAVADVNNILSTTYIPGGYAYIFSYSLDTTVDLDTIEFQDGFGEAKTVMEYFQDVPDLVANGGYWSFTYSGLDYLVDPNAQQQTVPIGGVSVPRRGVTATYIDGSIDPEIDPNCRIEFGVNLVDLTESISVEEVVTALHPSAREAYSYSAGGETSEGVYESYIKTLCGHSATGVHTLRGDIILSNAALAQYGYVATPKNYEEPVFNRAELYTMAKGDARYSDDYGAVRTLEVTAIDPALVIPGAPSIWVGSMVTFVSPPHDLDEQVECTAMDLDLLDPTRSRYTLGNTKSSLSRFMRANISETNNRISFLG